MSQTNEHKPVPFKLPNGLWKIKWNKGAGNLPKELTGGYTSERTAQQKIDNFYEAARLKTKKKVSSRGKVRTKQRD